MGKTIEPAGPRYDVVLWTEQSGQMVRGGVWLEGFARCEDAEKYCADANRAATALETRAEYRVEERGASYRERRYPSPPLVEGVNQ